MSVGQATNYGLATTGSWITELSATAVMVLIVFALLIIATALLLALRSAMTPAMYRQLGLRIRSWWVMVVIFVLAVTIDWRVSIVAMACLSFLALKEFLTLVRLRLADRRAILLSYLAIPAQYLWVWVKWYGMFIIFVPVYMFLTIAFRLVLAGETKDYLASVAKLHWGLMAMVFGLSHLAYLLVLPEIEGFSAGPRGLIFYVVFLAEFNDVLQYGFGKLFGRRALAPRVSPNKTWEGFLGGLLCTIGLAVALRFLTPFDWLEAMTAGVLIGLLGPIGDLVMSAIKRDIGVKDSGTLLPGHGGVLDRIDSLCFSVPIFFHYTTWLHYPMVH